MRLFFAAFPGDTERAALTAWQDILHKIHGGRRTRPDTLHLTLVFLGNVPPDRWPQLKHAAQEVRCNSFGLTLDTAVYWPHNHIVYAAPSAVPDPLRNLVDALEQRLGKESFGFDRRPYAPHMTLLRHAQSATSPAPVMPDIHWTVSSFALVQSRAGQGGGYQILEKYPLQ